MQPAALHVVRHHTEAPGLPIVLVHGAPDRSKNFARVVHALGEVPVTVYDRRGYGRSIDAAHAGDGFVGGFLAHADDLIDLLEGTRSVVCGQSAGGSIALRAASLRPDLFAALGVWEPPMVPWDWWIPEATTRTMEWANYADSRQLGEDVNRDIIGDRWDSLRESTREMLRYEGAAFRADMASQAEPFFDLDALSVPVLMGHGTVAPRADFVTVHHRTAERIATETFVGEGADHYAHTNHPEIWADFVRATVALAHRAHGDQAQASSGWSQRSSEATSATGLRRSGP